VLAALNLAYSLTEKPATEAVPTAHPSTVSSLNLPLDTGRLDALIQRVDAVLAQPAIAAHRIA
jgi:hypothetical protein